jgi:hypothetical protein
MNLMSHKIIPENSRRLHKPTTKVVLVMALSFILVQSFVSLRPAYAPPRGQAPEMGPSERGQAPEMGPSELEKETLEPGQAPEMGPSELENETLGPGRTLIQPPTGQAPEMGPSELENSTQ